MAPFHEGVMELGSARTPAELKPTFPGISGPPLHVASPHGPSLDRALKTENQSLGDQTLFMFRPTAYTSSVALLFIKARHGFLLDSKGEALTKV